MLFIAIVLFFFQDKKKLKICLFAGSGRELISKPVFKDLLEFIYVYSGILNDYSKR